MRIIFTFVVICLIFTFVDSVSNQLLTRSKRRAYDLPDGWFDLRNSINPSFECKDNGYYADIDNECQLYHVCQHINLPYSKPRFLQYTFICGNGTVFNQLTQTCTFEHQLSVPCESSYEFFYMNKRVGALNTWFHNTDDYERIRTVKNNNRFNAILNSAQNNFRNKVADEVDDQDDDFR